MEIVNEFVEIFVDTPIELCEARDKKGLYKKARLGQLTDEYVYMWNKNWGEKEEAANFKKVSNRIQKRPSTYKKQRYARGHIHEIDISPFH